MITESPLKEAREVRRLAEHLAKLPQVTRYSESEYDEAWTLAHAFEDLEESFVTLLSEKFPKLGRKDLSNEELYDLLLEIGEELRHIQYHIRDPKFYRYLSRGEEDAA